MAGAEHLGFRLSASGESIGLFAHDGSLLDGLVFGAQTAGLSEGRYPDGSENIIFFPGNATPASPNRLSPLRLTGWAMGPDGFAFEFTPTPGQFYSVQYRTDWGAAGWVELVRIGPAKDVTPVRVIDPTVAAGDNATRFYRVTSP
jgi:hypothetical protein